MFLGVPPVARATGGGLCGGSVLQIAKGDPTDLAGWRPLLSLTQSAAHHWSMDWVLLFAPTGQKNYRK
jgi:hypothetical protein